MVLFSALNSITDPVLYYLTYGVVIIAGLVLLMLVQVISFRIYSVYENRVNETAKNIWRPVLAEMMLSYPDNIPELQRKHRHVFLREWNRFHSLLRGEARLRLQILSRHKQLDTIAHAYLKSSNVRNMLQGIVTLGHMQDYSIWDRLIDIINSEHPILSMTAAQALTDLDSKNAIPYLMPHIIKRRDWPVARVAILLNSARPGELSKIIEQAIESASVDDIPYILGFLSSSHFDPATSKLCTRLGKSKDSRIIAACINAAKDSQGLTLAREHADHPQWYIRLHVARALGRLGTKDDLPVLIKLLSDPEWWVRYRSAQAITHMPFVTTQDLSTLYIKLDDRYARDILHQAISELEWS
jgi:hypothetical protein